MKLSTARLVLNALKKGVTYRTDRAGRPIIPLSAQFTDKARRFLQGKANREGTDISGVIRTARATMNRDNVDRLRTIVFKMTKGKDDLQSSLYKAIHKAAFAKPVKRGIRD
tara:strand:+ start:211 stop:543 length:333 start_codon:yes stop_codon:yes gene_type:complete